MSVQGNQIERKSILTTISINFRDITKLIKSNEMFYSYSDITLKYII